MTEAIFGLVGVLFGGGITIVEARLNAARERANEAEVRRRASQVARRLVASELLQVSDLLDGLDVGSLESRAFAFPQWEANRALLAADLSDGEWRVVSLVADSAEERNRRIRLYLGLAEQRQQLVAQRDALKASGADTSDVDDIPDAPGLTVATYRRHLQKAARVLIGDGPEFDLLEASK